MQRKSLLTAILTIGTLLSPYSSLGNATVHAQDSANTPAKSALKWKVDMLTLDSNEGCAIGDINGDGINDVVAGRNWYAAPDFKPRPVRTIEDWNGYVQSNGDFLMDVNGDGLLDVVAGSFIPTEVHWYENPGAEGWRLGRSWKKHLLVDTGVSENEAQLMEDIDGDGRPEWIVNSWNPKNPTMIWRFVPREATEDNPAKFELIGSTIGKVGNKHGMGVGDINNDGRIDVLTGAGWYEQPAEDIWNVEWKFHPDWDIQGSIPMVVRDVDGDGLNDIVLGAGHDYGLYWWKRKPASENSNDEKSTRAKLEFEQVVIDKEFSQPHALAFVDLDGDGKDELVSGKRYYAHNGGDPGGKDMPEIHFYRWNGKSFEKNIMEQGHVGVGLQIATGDLNGDGKNDVAVAGKSGTYILWNPHK